MDLSDESAGRLTRSKLRRLGSVDREGSSRPTTPLNKMITIAETDSPSRPIRQTRRNSVSSGAGVATPSKIQLLQTTKTSDVSTPKKAGRPRKELLAGVEKEKEKDDTPDRRVTRSQSISPPNSELVKTRSMKISPKIEEEEIDSNENTNEGENQKPEEKEKTSTKKRNMSESSKSVCFNDSVIYDGEKTVYPKTPLHSKTKDTTDKLNISNDCCDSFNELFSGNDSKDRMLNNSVEILEEEKSFNVSKSSQSKLSKLSSTPIVTQNLQVKLRKINDSDFYKKLSDNTPIKKLENSNEIVEISSNEKSKISEKSIDKSISKNLIYSSEEEEEFKSPITSKQDDMIVDSAENSRDLLLDSIVNEDGKVDCSQKRISLRFEKLQESMQEEKQQSANNSAKNISKDEGNMSNVQNESTKSVNLSKLKTKPLSERSKLNNSMPEKKSAAIVDKSNKPRYSTSILSEAKNRTIPITFEDDVSTLPKESKLKPIEDTVENSPTLSMSLNNTKEKMSLNNTRNSMSGMNVSKVQEKNVESKVVESSDQSKSVRSEDLEKSMTKKEMGREIVESEKMQQDDINENSMSVDNSNISFHKEEEEKEEVEQSNIIGSWSTMNVHGSSNQKIDSIKFDECKEKEPVDNEECVISPLTKKRRGVMQILDSSNDEASEGNDSEEVELDKEEKPYKYNSFVAETAMEAEETYESGDSLESELEEIMQENEIPTRAESLGSEDTEMSEIEDDAYENDSFLTTDNELDLLDYDDYDEGIKTEKKEQKRRFAFSSDSSSQEEDKEPKPKKPIRKRRCIVDSDDDVESIKEALVNKSKVIEEKKDTEVEDITETEKNAKKSRKSLNNSIYQPEEDLVEKNETINTSKKYLKQHNAENENNEDIEEITETEKNVKKSRKSLNISKFQPDEDLLEKNETLNTSKRSLKQFIVQNEDNEDIEVEEIIETKQNVKKSRKSLNISKSPPEEDLIEKNETLNTSKKSLKQHYVENEDNESLNSSKKSLNKYNMEMEKLDENNEQNETPSKSKEEHKMETGKKANNDSIRSEDKSPAKENKKKSPKKNQPSTIVNEDRRELESEENDDIDDDNKRDRKRKRMSQSFNQSNDDTEISHKHKKSKVFEIKTGTNAIFGKKQPDFECVEDRCAEILEAANRAKFEAKLKAKQQKSKKLLKVNLAEQNEENEDMITEMEMTEVEEVRQEFSRRALKNVPNLVTSKNYPIEEKIKSKQLSEDIVNAIIQKDVPVKQKKIKKNKKGTSETNSNKLLTSAGEVRVIPSTPPPMKMETIQTATGIVRIEPVTPKLTQRAGVLRESPVSPSIGFRMRKLMGEHEKLPECSNNKNTKKRKLNLEVEEPSNKILQPQWTSSGVFKVENNVLVTSNKTVRHVQSSASLEHLGASENALNFKKNAMSKAGLPTESSSKILQRKKRQQVQTKF